jgi:pimeloyl-ACP methyl ester carboxylesterase
VVNAILEDRNTHLVRGGPDADAVIFLLHGVGGTRRNWIDHGQLDLQLETALDAERSQRLLVVLPEGHLTDAERQARRFPNSQAFTQRLHDLVNDIRGTRAPRPAAFWAIAGVSMGARQALEYVLAAPGLEGSVSFRAVGCISPAIQGDWMVRRGTEPLAEALRRPDYYIAWGSDDYPDIKENSRVFTERLRRGGVNVFPADPNLQQRPGVHRWDSDPLLWQPCLKDFLVQLVSPRLVDPGS